MAILSEKEYVIRAYANHPARGIKIAIYGLGKNTEIVLDEFDCSNVVGLLDGVRTDGELFGKPILTIQQAHARGIRAVIIIGRAANVKIIYRRISTFCEQHGITVYDINGAVLGVEPVMERTFGQYQKNSAESLKKKIDKADVISFDLFDTLLMRRTLYPQDIFELVEKKSGASFVKRRIEAEMAFYREGKQPTIYEIYRKLEGCSPDLEIQTERQNLIVRKRIVEMLRYAMEKGKEIYFVSDMYLTAGILHSMLDSLGISVSRGRILVSCEHGVSKSNGLFQILREQVGSRKILHIGDNPDADIRSAVRYGVDDTFPIESSLAMLGDSYAADLLNYDQTLENRLIIGRFLSEQLNDPFLFSKSSGRFSVTTNYGMAYSFLAPMVLCFFAWLTESARTYHCQRILLASRDGFLLKRIYLQLLEQGFRLPQMEYFYVSRKAAVPAGCTNNEDILHASRLAFDGTLRDMLKERFGLEESEIAEQGTLPDKDYILLHRDAILRHAERFRHEYQNYLSTLNIPKDSRVGFFDFVSSGTCQKGLMNFVDFHLTGLYFAVINYETEYQKEAELHGMYGILNVFAKGYRLLEHYIPFESIMTSNEPTLSGFADGAPRFLEETRSAGQLAQLEEIHRAVLDYVNDMAEYFPLLSSVDKHVPDLIAGYLHLQYSEISCGWFAENKLVDEFCKRNFELSI